MLNEYISEAIKTAKYELLKDGTIYAEIPFLQGVYSNANTFEECRTILIEVLEEWIFVRLRKNLDIPIISNYNLNSLELTDATY